MLVVFFCFGWSAYTARQKSLGTVPLSSTRGGLRVSVRRFGLLTAILISDLSSIWVCRLILLAMATVWARHIFQGGSRNCRWAV